MRVCRAVVAAFGSLMAIGWPRRSLRPCRVAVEAVDVHCRVGVAADAEVGLGLGNAAGGRAGVAGDAGLEAGLGAANAAAHRRVALVLEHRRVVAAHRRRVGDALRAGTRSFDHRLGRARVGRESAGAATNISATKPEGACAQPSGRRGSGSAGPLASPPRGEATKALRGGPPTLRVPSGCSRWGRHRRRCGSRCTCCSRCRRSGRSSTSPSAP